MGEPITVTLARRGGQEFLELPLLELLCEYGSRRPVRVPLGLSAVRVGTSSECELVVPHPSISRVHCEVRLTSSGVVLRDLGSKNGTSLQGVSILEARLPPGTPALIGGARLWVERRGGPQRMALAAQARLGNALGANPGMRVLFHQLEQAAASDASILLHGESGTGKEVLALATHAASARAKGPFVVVDCSALAPSMVEAELFGHEPGAFTGAGSGRVGLLAQAHGGTLFLDEVGELPLDIQPRLLRALETREVRPLGGTKPCPAASPK